MGYAEGIMKATVNPLLLLLAPLILLFSGCATRYPVRVDALSTLSARPAVQQSYVLVNNTPGDDADSLFFKEVGRHLGPALRNAGLVAAGDGAADLQIAVKAYLSEPLIETRTTYNPVYMDYPGQAVMVRVPIVNAEGKVVRFAYTQYYTHPRRDLAGYVDRDLQVTVYDKILELSARSLGPDGSTGGEVWSIKISLRSESTDYRAALPAMVVAAGPYIGRQTAGEEVIVLREDAEDLRAFRRMLADGR